MSRTPMGDLQARACEARPMCCGVSSRPWAPPHFSPPGLAGTWPPAHCSLWLRGGHAGMRLHGRHPESIGWGERRRPESTPWPPDVQLPCVFAEHSCRLSRLRSFALLSGAVVAPKSSHVEANSHPSPLVQINPPSVAVSVDRIKTLVVFRDIYLRLSSVLFILLLLFWGGSSDGAIPRLPSGFSDRSIAELSLLQRLARLLSFVYIVVPIYC